jgi:hypothetical protein
MVYKENGLLQLTDTEVDALARQFVSSPYADRSKYSDWSLDRRVEGFLHQRGLGLLAEDGDAHELILETVMRHISAATHPVQPGDDRADQRPVGRGLLSLSSTTTRWSDEHSQYGDFEI